MEYRIQSTGEVKTQGEVRRMHSNTSLPRVWDANVCSALGIDPVLEAPKPEVTGYTQAVRDGVIQDANGNWVQAWTVVDMFADTTEDGVTTTKAEHEAAYQADLDAKAAASVRAARDAKLAESDWMVIKSAETGVALATEWATYRQALRDITTHANFPNLEEADWPVAP
jgi:hypothetical protein